ncbi:flagellin [Luminiphilus sp.]|jgi:flagellin|nr:flagellin [Luminiphilus sp.]
MLVVNSNTAAAFAQNALVKTGRQMNTALEQLSTGVRINGAEDDAAGLAIASRMTSQVIGLSTGIKAASDAIGLVSTVDGALAEMGEMYQRLRELALIAENGTNSQQDIRILQAEFDAVVGSIESVITHTTYQGYNVFFNPSGQLSSHLDWRNDGQAVVMNMTFTLGDTGTVSTSFTPDGAGGSYSFVDSEVLSGWGYFFYMNSNSNSDSVIGPFRNDPSASMFSNQVLDPSHADYRKQVSIGSADDTVTNIDNLLDNVNASRSKLGALHNQLVHATNSMSTTLTNTLSSRSTILDTDYAVTTAHLAKTQILTQASTAMLAQANALPEVILQLLQR